MRTLSLLTAAVILLAGCVEDTGPKQVGSIEGEVAAVVVPPNASATVRPGPEPVSIDAAIMLFEQVCISHYPDLKASEGAVRRLPFAQLPATGTYYHQKLDLSFKFIPEKRACSLVFGSREDPVQLAMMFGAVVSNGTSASIDMQGHAMASGPKGSRFEFGPTSKAGGRTYYHAVLFR